MKIRLSGNVLKLLAALFMLFDHMGLLLFPNVIWLRIIGRLSFPIFAFMISEGAKYTRNKKKYFLSVFIVGAVCQIVYMIASGGYPYFNIFLTFSIAILLIYLSDFVKRRILSEEYSGRQKLFAILALFLALVLTAVVNWLVTFDYGFYGCILPLLASLPCFDRETAPALAEKYDRLPIRLGVFAFGLLLLAIDVGTLQFFSLLSLPLLLLYSGKRGRLKMKYFFYVFYPAHLVILYGIRILMIIL